MENEKKWCKHCKNEYFPEELNKNPETKKLKDKLKARNHDSWCLNCVKTAHDNNFQGEWAGNNLSPGDLPDDEYDHTHWQFRHVVMWLEKYIEVLSYYPDWPQRKQLDNSSIKRKDVNDPQKIERTFPTMLGFLRLLVYNPPWLLNELKEEFYKWINATGINADNCPERLKHYLFGIHEILEGETEKFDKERKNRKRELHPNSPEYAEKVKEGFNVINEILASGEVDKIKENEKGRFNGNVERGKETFQQIANSISNNDYQNFHFFPQMSSEEREEYKRKKGKDYISPILHGWRTNSINEITQALNQEPKITNNDLELNNQNWEEQINQTEDIIKIQNIKGAVLADIQTKRQEKKQAESISPKTNYVLWTGLGISGFLLISLIIWLATKKKNKQ
ncbi:hypothetical protein [endosymbiont GvMRE of Glomus versiforme]|uniref:hypothetical protein n=1 Tax=endosymbiont GvMRE of Glomus versiforme TaxID=2039283 RepID=UPI000ED54AC4|nr:hypothetical protein [endosymbiont GvMRE of Glomus versiforme]RHZ36851.1 hypothetical protein GvMRE_I2g616 [endosymbiont GvMRE of Glomus versiforme]